VWKPIVKFTPLRRSWVRATPQERENRRVRDASGRALYVVLFGCKNARCLNVFFRSLLRRWKADVIGIYDQLSRRCLEAICFMRFYIALEDYS